ncbi:hypothetical protein INT47_012781 [Mucor saturninus]|uniref:3'-5' exonuclease n=1 Tax=Mucor saturninus TaxID=64648 RepID=A0A8H7QH40_9FUNG|nr:hypothetical protein INT47_012781 [Mucor saturninus]
MQSRQVSISNFLSDNSTSADLEHTQYIESDINQIATRNFLSSSAIDVPEASILADGNFSTSDSLVDEDNSDEDDGDDNDAESEQFQENLTRNSALFQYFEKVQSDLSKTKYPPPYSSKTFWIRPMDTYFAIQLKSPLSELYKPDIFLWHPHHLLQNGYKDLKCISEQCSGNVTSKGYYKDPHARRAVGLTRCFYIMSYRYACSSCKVTFNAHDPKLMVQLPIELQEAFPAIITHKGAVSREVADLLRPCVQNSVGPKRFSKIIRELHMLEHDRLELIYLTNILKKKKKEAEGVGAFFKSAPTIYAPFSSFDDQSGYAGYVPTPVYFRTLYTSIIEKLRPFMDKMLMLTGGKIIRGDHSFKIVNHIAKIEKSSAFTALYTVVNEYEEIRLMSLVPSKSHSYLKWSFEKMYEAYKMYGHELPTVFFTDDVRADRRFIESVIPSLTAGVQKQSYKSIDSNYKTLPELELPDFVNVGYFNQFLQIETVISDLNDKLSIECEGTIAVGFDCEWSFDEETSRVSNGVDTIQIAYGNEIFVLHLNQEWSNLPQSLKLFLSNKNILKVGKNVSGDLNRIERTFSGVKCQAPIELGKFCKNRGLIEHGKFSLSDISAKVLGYQLNKDERLGNWSVPRLSDLQLKYAALDAWASLRIFEEAKLVPEVGTRLASNSVVVPGTYVRFRPRGENNYVALGRIDEQKEEDWKEFKSLQKSASGTRVIVTILHVPSPAFIPSRLGKSLASYLPVPFKLPILKSELETESEEIVNGCINRDISGNNNSVARSTIIEDIEDDSTSNAQVLTNEQIREELNSMFEDCVSDVDQSSFEYGYKKIMTIKNLNDTLNQDRVFSRVIKDVFHLMDLIKTPSNHGLQVEFSRRFRDVLLVLDAEDKTKVEKVLKENMGTTSDEKMKYDSDWIWKRVKRRVREPCSLFTQLKTLFLTFGPMKCSVTGSALFDHVAWNQVANILHSVNLGHVSDPPDVVLYVVFDKILQ